MSKASLLSRSRGDRAMRMKSLTLLLVLMTASVAFAAGAEIEGKASVPENTIRINSDKLVADIDGNTVIFSGNVRVDRGAARITADHLKLYYNREKSADPVGQVDESAFEKMEAYGKVRIQFGDALAQSESAVYETGTGTLILEGRRATVTNGAYTIEGDRVVLNDEAGDMTVVGGDGGRVKATIISGSSLF